MQHAHGFDHLLSRALGLLATLLDFLRFLVGGFLLLARGLGGGAERADFLLRGLGRRYAARGLEHVEAERVLAFLQRVPGLRDELVGQLQAALRVGLLARLLGLFLFLRLGLASLVERALVGDYRGLELRVRFEEVLAVERFGALRGLRLGFRPRVRLALVGALGDRARARLVHQEARGLGRLLRAQLGLVGRVDLFLQLRDLALQTVGRRDLLHPREPVVAARELPVGERLADLGDDLVRDLHATSVLGFLRGAALALHGDARLVGGLLVRLGGGIERDLGVGVLLGREQLVAFFDLRRGGVPGGGRVLGRALRLGGQLRVDDLRPRSLGQLPGQALRLEFGLERLGLLAKLVDVLFEGRRTGDLDDLLQVRLAGLGVLLLESLLRVLEQLLHGLAVLLLFLAFPGALERALRRRVLGHLGDDLLEFLPRLRVAAGVQVLGAGLQRRLGLRELLRGLPEFVDARLGLRRALLHAEEVRRRFRRLLRRRRAETLDDVGLELAEFGKESAERRFHGRGFLDDLLLDRLEVGAQLAKVAVALARVPAHRLLEDLRQVGGDLRLELGDRRRLAVLDLLEQLLRVVADVRRTAGEHLVEDRGQRVLVRSRGGFSLGVLGRHVPDGRDRQVGHRAGSHLRAAEVDQLGRPVGQDHDLARLQVAVDDVLAVGVLERAAELGHRREAVLEGQAPVGRDAAQVPALEQLHDGVKQVTFFADVVDRDDVRVTQAGRRLGLREEPGLELFGDLAVRRDHLDGDEPVQAGVLGLVDRPHVAAADAVDDVVLADLLFSHSSSPCRHDHGDGARTPGSVGNPWARDRPPRPPAARLPCGSSFVRQKMPRSLAVMSDGPRSSKHYRQRRGPGERGETARFAGAQDPRFRPADTPHRG